MWQIGFFCSFALINLQLMKITKTSAPSPKGEISLFTITNAKGAKVTLSSLGAGIVRVELPESDGSLTNVVIGYADPADYIADGPCARKSSRAIRQPYSQRASCGERQRISACYQ